MSSKHDDSLPYLTYFTLLLVMFTMPTCSQVQRIESGINGLRADVQALKSTHVEKP